MTILMTILDYKDAFEHTGFWYIYWRAHEHTLFRSSMLVHEHAHINTN
jgi:hypothetical protein